MSATGAGPGGQGAGGEPAPVADLSYTEASRELDDIVAFFEQREVDVDQLVARLERAAAIVDELDRRIRQTRLQVEQLVPRLEAATRHELEEEASGRAATDQARGEDEEAEEEDEEELLDEDLAEEDLEEGLGAWDESDDDGPSGEAGTERPLF